jgi:hypothetical protein
MAMFEIEANGETYEVEAPDEAAAMAAIGTISGGGNGGGMQSIGIPGVKEFQDFSRAFQTGATQGLTFGFADEMLAGVEAPFRAGYNMIANGVEGFDLGRGFQEGLDSARGNIEGNTALNPGAALAGDVTGAVVTGGTAAKAGLSLLSGAKATIPSLATRGAAEGAIYGGLRGAGDGDSLESRGQGAKDGALWGGVTGGILGGGAGALAGRAARKAAPSLQQLDVAAGAKYDAARASGVVAPQSGTQGISQTIRKIAVDEGLISPTGRLDTTRPYIAEALKTFEDYSKGTMTVPQMQSVRRKLTDAAKSTEPGERRIAMKMLDEFDAFTDKLAPQLAEGNEIYRQLKKGEMIEQTIELAGSRAGQFSGSGFENALRTEFRALERAIIKGELKGLSQAEIDAITKVARGGPVENILRYVGKLAPTGVVSFGAGAGVPFMVGNAVGGPAAGAAAAGATMGAGFLGRAGATALTNRNAQIASALMRNGGPLNSQMSPGADAIAQALIASGGQQGQKAGAWPMTAIPSLVR